MLVILFVSNYEINIKVILFFAFSRSIRAVVCYCQLVIAVRLAMVQPRLTKMKGYVCGTGWELLFLQQGIVIMVPEKLTQCSHLCQLWVYSWVVINMYSPIFDITKYFRVLRRGCWEMQYACCVCTDRNNYMYEELN